MFKSREEYKGIVFTFVNISAQLINLSDALVKDDSFSICKYPDIVISLSEKTPTCLILKSVSDKL